MIRKSMSIASLAAITVLFSTAIVMANAQRPSPVVVEVKIDNFSFGPQAQTVQVGTTVTWTNRDDIPHTVVSTDGVFKSKVLDTDETFSYAFAKAGTFAYFCSIHPKMTGKIVVQ
jgi:plastocyanin